MRVTLVLAFALVLALPSASARAADDEILALAQGDAADPIAVLLAQLARQDGTPDARLAARSPPAPPDLVYRDLRAACDLDGDGAEDVLVNNLTLGAPPSHAGAASEIEALSGSTGERLWKVDNLAYVSMPAPSSVPYGARGQAFPDAPASARPTIDLDEDGACDLIAFGFERLSGFSMPFVGEPSVSNTRFSLRALSGRTGEDLWSQDVTATTTSASDPLFGTQRNVVTKSFPTGVVTFDAPEGPRIVVKLTDLRYHMADMPIGVSGVPTLAPGKDALKGPLHAEDVRITEHVRLLDARSGEILWERILGSEEPSQDVDGRFTNLTWLSGVTDLGGDDAPDLILDQVVLTTPRTTEANHPATGDTLFRYGRGARTTALDGATGGTLWVANFLEPLAAEPNAEAEENFETLVWVRSDVTEDLDADGVPEVLATYTAQEESLSTSAAGAYRTHLIPLSGANGTALWDVRQQGWGIAQAIGGGLLGVGMLDVPTEPPEGGPFPPRFVRMLALDAATGETQWSYERSSPQNSILSYNLALSQFSETLAPRDWDGDGVRDLVTPAQESPRTDRDQVLLATSSHTYGILSGVNGKEIASVRAWGPDGRVVSCPGDEARLTVLSGHARRLELQRFDPMTGERAWRHIVHNDAAPRAATTAIDATGIGASCVEIADGTLYAVDLQAFSFDRRHEVVPILGSLDGAGDVVWQTPALRGAPPGEALFQASIDDAAPTTGALWATAAFAVAFGLAGAFVTIALLARAGAKLLVVGLVLVVLAPSAVSLALPATAPSAPDALSKAPPVDLASGAAPLSGSPQDALRSAAASIATMRALLVDGEAPSNESLSRFNDQGTITYTRPLGDVDGDGYDDVLLDQYCVSADACDTFIRIPEDMTSFLINGSCSSPHDLVVVSGRDGSILWTQDVTVRGPFSSCGEEFVVGPIDVAGERAILLYRYQLIWYSGINLEGIALHDFRAVSAATGETLWTYSGKGTYATDFVASYVTKDYVIVPILLGPPGADQALFLQGVGWTAAASSTLFPVAPLYPLTDEPVVLWHVHDPVEWAARIDLDTGSESWKRDTFQPTPGVSAIPRAQMVDMEDAWIWGRGAQIDHYWEDRACCGDLTGDGVPDLAFDVSEWSPAPYAKAAGPKGLDLRAVVLDGATGETHLDAYVAKDMPLALDNNWNERFNFILGIFVGRFTTTLAHEPVGDVDGDGADDLLRHVLVRTPEYRQNLTLVSGKTGEALWSMETHRDLRALVLGDADGDGGNDMLLLDWYGHEAGAEMWDDFTTPDAVPLNMVSGRTGERLWQATSYAAPADIVESFKSIRRNGVVDVDADGVGDFFTDDPLYLDDQTVVHQTSIISGRDGRPLRMMRTVGAFAIPSGAGDLDHDGRGEVALLSGDMNDLWLTVYDGASGEPEWSRRILALPATGYARALPFLKLDPLATPDGADALAITFHADVMRPYTFFGMCIGCDDDAVQAGERTRFWEATMPQILRVEGARGDLSWALPKLDAVDGAARVIGATPGATSFDAIAERASAVGLLSTAGREARPFALPALGGFGLAYAIGLAAGIGIVRFRSRFAGVPELD